MNFISSLKNRAVISVSGVEAKEFLQATISNNIENCPIYSLLLSPQGKFLYDFFIVHHQEKYLIDCNFIQKEDLIKNLNLYKLRRNIVIEDVSEKYRIIVSSSNLNINTFFADPRMSELGFRAIADRDLEFNETKDFDYDYYRLKFSVACGLRDMIPNKSFPLEFRMDYLNAIDFNKGCYVGQEVTSRTKYRGTLHKKLCLLAAEKLPIEQSEIIFDGLKIGNMCSVNKDLGLALIYQEFLEDQNLHKKFGFEIKEF